jgi:hypothetical protein
MHKFNFPNEAWSTGVHVVNYSHRTKLSIHCTVVCACLRAIKRIQKEEGDKFQVRVFFYYIQYPEIIYQSNKNEHKVLIYYFARILIFQVVQVCVSLLVDKKLCKTLSSFIENIIFWLDM